MSTCLMTLLTFLAVPVLGLTAFGLYNAAQKALTALRAARQRTSRAPMLVPAFAAAAVVVLGVVAVGTGWEHAEPCGGRTASLRAPAPAVLVCAAIDTIAGY